MKTKLRTLLLATSALAMLAGGLHAQTPPAGGAAPTAMPAVPPLAQRQPAFDVTQLPATRGSVKFFTMTPRGDVDGFVLGDNTQVHVPPHLSTQLVGAVRIGDAVTVRGLRAAAVPLVAAMAVTADASGVTVVDLGPPGRPGNPPEPGRGGPGDKHEHGPGGPGGRLAGPPSEASGKVLLVLHGPQGEANGAMLEDGTALRLPPPEAMRLAAMLAPGQTVVAQGPGIANNLGRMIDVRQIGASRDALTQVKGPPRHPHGPGEERRGPKPGGPDADRRAPPPPPGDAGADGAPEPTQP